MTVASYVVLGLVAAAALAAIVPARIALRARARKRSLSRPPLVGARGWCETRLDPWGQVIVRGELWEAGAERPAPAGTPVRVVGARGTRLLVSPLEDASGGHR